jgi:hypothetical protein
MGAKIIPVVIFGAYELYPPNVVFTAPGKVTLAAHNVLARMVHSGIQQIFIRYLAPIEAEQVRNSSREDVSTLVRERMLRALRNSPKHAGGVLSLSDRLDNIFALTALFSFNTLLYKAFSAAVISLGVSTSFVLWWMLTLSVVFTLFLFIVRVQLAHKFRPKKPTAVSITSSPQSTSPQKSGSARLSVALRRKSE